MGLGLGIKSWIQFGPESAWATAAAATHRLGFSECSIETKIVQAHSPNMPSAGVTGAAWMTDSANAGIEIVGEYAGGQLVVPMDYDGLLRFFDMVFGAGAFGTYGATVSGAGPYVHTFGPEKEFLNSLTIQIYEGGVLASNVARVVGAKVTGLTLSGKAGSPCILTLDIIGQQKQLGQTPTAAITCIPRVPVHFSHITAFDDGTADSNTVLREFEFSIRPSIAAPEWRDGTKYIREPVRDGLITTTLKLVREYSSDSIITAYKAGTLLTGKPSLQFASGTKAISIAFQAAKIVGAPQPKPALKGIMLQEVTYEAQWTDATNGGVSVAITTAQNAAAA